jgi:uncharacterized protein YheU (UPF0270 family)
LTQDKPTDHHEQGVDVPYEQLHPDTLRRLLQEFVTRDGSAWSATDGTLEDKVGQVLQQLRANRVKVVFDLTSQTANIVVCR